MSEWVQNFTTGNWHELKPEPRADGRREALCGAMPGKWGIIRTQAGIPSQLHHCQKCINARERAKRAQAGVQDAQGNVCEISADSIKVKVKVTTK